MANLLTRRSESSIGNGSWTQFQHRTFSNDLIGRSGSFSCYLRRGWGAFRGSRMDRIERSGETASTRTGDLGRHGHEVAQRTSVAERKANSVPISG